MSRAEKPRKRPLGPTIRQRICALLADGIPRTSAEISAHLGGISHDFSDHLCQLRKRGVLYRDDGNTRGYHYRYSDRPLDPAIPQTARICPTCGEEKELTIAHWYVQTRNGQPGWMTVCKECRKKQARATKEPIQGYDHSTIPSGRVTREFTDHGTTRVSFGAAWKPHRDGPRSTPGLTGYASALTQIY